MKWDIHPDKVEAYAKWAKTAINRILSVPGVVEFRAYRPVTGASQIVTTNEFADMAAWAAWQSDKDVQKVMDEFRTLTLNVNIEIWGPSPVVPVPIRP
ncbi:MAG: antibiotic biosynthesis monooxygenase [Bacteroidetes bacterium]|nr:antibiotic biosynthesis monooxygenase [Bacteroidota bacterium]